MTITATSRVLISLLLASAFASPPAIAQSIVNATATATIAATPADVSTANAIIAALYDANTNMVDRKTDADRFRSLFVPGGRLMPTSRGPEVRARSRFDPSTTTRGQRPPVRLAQDSANARSPAPARCSVR